MWYIYISIRIRIIIIFEWVYSNQKIKNKNNSKKKKKNKNKQSNNIGMIQQISFSQILNFFGLPWICCVNPVVFYTLKFIEFSQIFFFFFFFWIIAILYYNKSLYFVFRHVFYQWLFLQGTVSVVFRVRHNKRIFNFNIFCNVVSLQMFTYCSLYI